MFLSRSFWSDSQCFCPFVISLSVCMSGGLPICQCNFPFGHFVCLSVCLSVCMRLSFCVPDSPSICQCFFPFVILPVCLFLCVPVILSVCLFLRVRHFLYITVHLSVSVSFHSSICLSVYCLFVSVCPTVRLSVRVSLHSSFCLSAYFCASFILSVRVCFCVRVIFYAWQSVYLSVNLSILHFVCLSVCSFLCVRHFVCLTIRLSLSVSFPSNFLSVCFSGWLHLCVSPNYKIYLLNDDNKFHSVTYIDFHVSNKLFRIQSVNLSIILWSLLSCLC